MDPVELGLCTCKLPWDSRELEYYFIIISCNYLTDPKDSRLVDVVYGLHIKALFQLEHFISR